MRAGLPDGVVDDGRANSAPLCLRSRPLYLLWRLRRGLSSWRIGRDAQLRAVLLQSLRSRCDTGEGRSGYGTGLPGAPASPAWKERLARDEPAGASAASTRYP